MDVFVLSVPSYGKNKKDGCNIDFDKMDYSSVAILENTGVINNFNNPLAFEACTRIAETINVYNNKTKDAGDKATFRIGATYNHTGFVLCAMINTLSGPFIFKNNMPKEYIMKYIEPIRDLVDSIIFELETFYPFSKFEDQCVMVDKNGSILLNLVDMDDMSHIPKQNISGFNSTMQ